MWNIILTLACNKRKHWTTHWSLTLQENLLVDVSYVLWRKAGTQTVSSVSYAKCHLPILVLLNIREGISSRLA